jgi:ankyrin repeat protein
MNLEQLRKQAKELVKAARAGEAGALARLESRAVQLASAQHVIAQKHGYPSWADLVHAQGANVESFVRAATSSRRAHAERLLAARPEIERDRWAALVLGRGWEGDSNEVGGPLSWAPLHYVCHSCFAPVALARELLAQGADPNAFFANDYGPMSALYGAAGVRHDPELTRVLLEAGADPNGEPHFGDALYHSVEAESAACLRLLLEHGAEPRGSVALPHALDYDHVEHVKLLLEARADPNEGAVLVHAVRRGCASDTLRLLAEHGAELDRPGGEWARRAHEQRTAYQHAVLRGRHDQAAVLAELGASTDVSPGDLAVAAVVRGERPEQELPDELGPDAQEALALTAIMDGKLDLVVDLVGPNFFAHVGGGPPGMLLHHACWVGYPDTSRRLLERGADPLARSGAEFDLPIAWAALGSQYWELPGRDYVAVVKLLLEAGAELEPRFDEVAEGPLADWLAERAIAFHLPQSD